MGGCAERPKHQVNAQQNKRLNQVDISSNHSQPSVKQPTSKQALKPQLSLEKQQQFTFEKVKAAVPSVLTLQQLLNILYQGKQTIQVRQVISSAQYFYLQKESKKRSFLFIPDNTHSCYLRKEEAISLLGQA